jgi:outer membrane protein OmpA-like peptidoglycan-associated protein
MKITIRRFIAYFLAASVFIFAPACKSSKKNKKAPDGFDSYVGKRKNTPPAQQPVVETPPPSETTEPKSPKTLTQEDIVRLGNGVQVTFDPGVYFSFDSADLTPTARESITNLTEVLSKYAYTNMVVEGHTDNYGPRRRNMTLSEERANTFANYAKERGMDVSRITTKGYGPDKPRYSNATLESRKKNRRIDAVITASEEMMRRIANGEL